MLTAAVAMSAGAEQASVLSVPPVRMPAEGMSFAKSFGEGVALAVDVPTKIGSDKGAAEHLDFKRGAAMKIADAPVTASVAVKAGPVARPLEAVGSGSKTFAAKIVIVAAGVEVATAGVVAGKKPKEPQPMASVLAGIRAGSADGVEGAVVGVVKDVGGVDDAVTGFGIVAAAPDGKVEVSTEAPPVQQHAADTAATDGVAVQEKIVQGGDVVSGDAEVPAGKITTEVPEEMGAAASTKTSSKGKEQKGTHAETAKSAGAIDKVAVNVAKMTLESVAAAGVSVPVATVVPVEMPSNEAVKEQKSDTGKATSTGRSTGAVAASVVAGKSGKVIADAGKTAPASGTAAPSADGASAVRAEPEFAKSAALAIGGDGVRKNERSDAVAGSSHGVAGEGSALAGLISGVAPSHLAGDGVSAKLPTQDGQAAAAVLHAGHGDLDGSGAAMPSTIDGGHRTLMATPTTLEVGIANGTHGWLKIRAEMATGGVVNASVSAATATGQEMLHRELPSLTAYLQQEQVAVNTLVVHPAIAGNPLHGVAGGMAGDMSGQAQQRSNQGGEGRQGLAGTVLSYTDEAGYESANRTGVDELLSPATYVGGGSWLNVRA